LIYSIVERHGYDGLVLATMMAGLIMIAAGFLRWGTYIKYIPFPVIVGFTAGIAIIIFSSQLKEMLGLDVVTEPAAFLPKLGALWAAIDTVKTVTVGLSGIALVIILLLRRLRPAWPAMLVAVMVSAALTGFLHLDVATIGTRFGGVPDGLPAPVLPHFDLAKMRDLWRTE
jgi:sulfate permease, SulP family